MKKLILYGMFLLGTVGCAQPFSNKVQQELETQVKLFIDSGYIQSKYVMLCELAINDSNHLYGIAESELPIDSRLLLPAKISKYKDKYLCFFELDEAEMSMKALEKITNYAGSPMPDSGICLKWMLVISKLGQKKKIVNIEKENKGFLDYTEFWPYLSGYVKNTPVQMIIQSHDVETYRHYPFNVDSVRQHLFYYTKHVYGEIYLRNNTDSTICLSSDSRLHFAIINNQDSFYLSLCDSLPIILEPYEKKIVLYKSIPNRSFFKKMASEKRSWDDFYNLFCRSTYCLMKINQEELKMKIMHDDYIYPAFWVTDMNGEEFYLLNQGIYDKEKGANWRGELWWGDTE